MQIEKKKKVKLSIKEKIKIKIKEEKLQQGTNELKLLKKKFAEENRKKRNKRLI